MGIQNAVFFVILPVHLHKVRPEIIDDGIVGVRPVAECRYAALDIKFRI